MSALAEQQFQPQAPPAEQYQHRRSSVIGKFVDRFRSGSGAGAGKPLNSRGGLLPDDYYENKNAGGGDAAPAAEEPHVPPPAAARSKKRGSITMSASALSAKIKGGRREPNANGAGAAPAESTPGDPWAGAYNALRDDQATAALTLAYESVIAKQLPKQFKQGGQDAPLRGGSDQERADLMTTITRAGLNKRQPVQYEDEAQAMLDSCRESVAAVMPSDPALAAAWAGLCTMTPELFESAIQRNDMRAGVIHVVGRVKWYAKLDRLLDAKSWNDEGVFREKQETTRRALAALHRAVLELEMNCVCVAASDSDPAVESAVDWDELGGMVRRVMQADDDVLALVEMNCTPAALEELLALDTDFHMPTEEDEDGKADQQDGGAE